MQQEWDYIDKIISDSCPKVFAGSNYDMELMRKLHHTEKSNTSNKVMALSFIMSGFLMMIFNTPRVQYFFINLAFALKSSIIMFQQII